jgi:hypothetical protein
MFHLLAYTGSLGVNAADTDLTAATDPEISQRNGHYIFTEQYEILAISYLATSATRVNIQSSTLNQYTKFNVWPVNRSLNTPSNPQLNWWGGKRPMIPQNEEFQMKGSNNLGAGSEQSTGFIWLAPFNQWNANLPAGKQGVPVIEARVNFTTPTLVANSWSGLGAITFEQNLRGGTYAVVGCDVQGAAINAFRMVFPRGPIFHNRRLRPGNLVNQAIGDIPPHVDPTKQFMYGEWGRFSTFEPFQTEWWANTAGAVAVEMRVYLVWLSDSMDVQY